MSSTEAKPGGGGEPEIVGSTRNAGPKEWAENAIAQAVVLKDSLATAADAAANATASALSTAVSASRFALEESKNKLEKFKTQYVVQEDLAVGKVKEGILVAADHPAISSGVVLGFALIAFRGPRQMVIRNIRRIFVSEESLLTDAEVRVNELRQSINLVNKESKKLEERALKAQSEIENGRDVLIKGGRSIRSELRYISLLEKQVKGLKELIDEIPGKAVPKYQTEIHELISQIKDEKGTLNKTASKIINYGIKI